MDNNASIDKAAIDANISRTVDKAALRKVRNLVDNFERDEHSEKAKQFNVMLWTIVAIVIIGVPLGYITGFSKAGAANKVATKTDCMSRAMARQRAALAQDLRGANPTIAEAELNRRLDSYNDMFSTSARTECRHAR